MFVSVHPCISALCLYVAVNGLASQGLGAVTTKPAALKNTHTCPLSPWMLTEDRGVFEGQTKKAQGPGAKERKKN